ncbi:hypothetical protein FQA47_003516 [Oryzias melastigma]|uniref:Uncharacterized protein n=1 Tax=Oryzias melastigma TaxID=30732 RepID=A0A834F7U6_ORYME|nr:hypothetical protein FQA47_003516 [Oryzias melastigma]
MRLECWSCSPVRRKGCRREEEAAPGLAPRRCAHACCAYACGAQLTPDPAGWGENSDSGQGTFSQRTTRCTTELEASRTNPSLEDGETDPEDTSAFDYSSCHLLQPRRHPAQGGGGEHQRGVRGGGQPGAGAAEALRLPAAGQGGAEREDGLPEMADPPTDPPPPPQEPHRAASGRAGTVPPQLLWEEVGQRPERVAASAPEKCLQAHLGRPDQADGLCSGEGQPAGFCSGPNSGQTELLRFRFQQGRPEAGSGPPARRRRPVGQRGQRGSLQHRLNCSPLRGMMGNLTWTFERMDLHVIQQTASRGSRQSPKRLLGHKRCKFRCR